ncbi:MAG TPA: PA2779 family protein [Terracidiphilus sp.]|nr:PA2779 family protein [Terracidiphilus sp.]
MQSQIRQFSRVLTAAVLAAAFTVPTTLLAQAPDHLVPPSALQQAAVSASHARRQNVDTLQNFFSSPEAQKALESARMNPQEVKKAVYGLSDQEVAQLAQRATRAQSDFAAGDLTNRDLLIILVCIAALILIIVAVH